MEYVTSVERLAMEEGVEEGSRLKAHESVIAILETRFGELAESILIRIEQINKIDILDGQLLDAD